MDISCLVVLFHVQRTRAQKDDDSLCCSLTVFIYDNLNELLIGYLRIGYY